VSAAVFTVNVAALTFDENAVMANIATIANAKTNGNRELPSDLADRYLFNIFDRSPMII
jgi:hypothetical protein